MSSRRLLKKEINSTMELLYADCIFYQICVKDANIAEADKLMSEISDIHQDLVGRLSASEGKELKSRTKSYYKKLKADYVKAVNEIGEKINKLG